MRPKKIGTVSGGRAAGGPAARFATLSAALACRDEAIESFCIRDDNGQALAYVYFEHEPGFPSTHPRKRLNLLLSSLQYPWFSTRVSERSVSTNSKAINMGSIAPLARIRAQDGDRRRQRVAILKCLLPLPSPRVGRRISRAAAARADVPQHGKLSTPANVCSESWSHGRAYPS